MKPRAKIIPDKLFFKLWKAANEGYDKHNYISNFTSSTSVDFVDFKNKYGIYYEEATEMLRNIYEAVNMPFDELIKKTGKKKSQIRDIFCIPQRTVEDWCYGKAKPNQSIKLMILRKFHLLHLGKYIHVQSEIEFAELKPRVIKNASFLKHEKMILKMKIMFRKLQKRIRKNKNTLTTGQRI